MSSEDGVHSQKIDGDAKERKNASHESGTIVQKKLNKSDEQKKQQKGDNVNAALRRAYESTVDEVIPSSMLDLLNKLD